MDQKSLETIRKGLTPDIVKHLDDIIDFLPTPPDNSSEYTMKELKYLQRVCNGATENEKILALRFDADPLIDINDYAVKHQCMIDHHFNKKISEAKAIVLLLKLHYGRPRPYQLGLAMNMPVWPLPSITAQTPSYVSGHTAVAYLAAKLLAKDNPEHEMTLIDMADRVRLSREIGGWHYPSDNDAAVVLASYLAEHLK